MTISLNGSDIGEIIAVASIVGTIVSILIVSLVIYLLVRPPRHIRERRKAEKRGELGAPMEPYEVEQLWRVVDRMEERLAVLERAIADEAQPRLGRDEEDIMEPVEDRDQGRTK